MKVTALAGGVGGSKLLAGFAGCGADLTAVVNTADDVEMYGLHVSPDIDVCTYRLAGLSDPDKGWGIAGDTFTVVEALGHLGSENWFRLGDRDLATCLLRTQMLAAGNTLTEVTDHIRRMLGVDAVILPMSDDEVRTRVVTSAGETLDFQDYFVKRRQQPDVTEIRFSGVADARPGPEVLAAIRDATTVVICPSNPFVSIAPILALPDVRAAVGEHPDVVAVSPIVAGEAIKGPAAAMLRSLNGGSSAVDVARLYEGVADRFVLDDRDASLAEECTELGFQVVVTDTIMDDEASAQRLAKAIS